MRISFKASIKVSEWFQKGGERSSNMGEDTAMRGECKRKKEKMMNKKMNKKRKKFLNGLKKEKKEFDKEKNSSEGCVKKKNKKFAESADLIRFGF